MRFVQKTLTPRFQGNFNLPQEAPQDPPQDLGYRPETPQDGLQNSQDRSQYLRYRPQKLPGDPLELVTPTALVHSPKNGKRLKAPEPKSGVHRIEQF